MRQAVLTCYDISGVEMQLREVQASVLGQNWLNALASFQQGGKHQPGAWCTE